MNSYNIQLKAILHSYEVNNSRVVYNKNDGCFYTVGSICHLNQKEYETKSADVAAKIENFIADNRKCLDEQLLKQLNQGIASRILTLKAKTTGLWAIFYYAFNPEQKAKLKQDQLLQENLKNKLEDTLLQMEEKSLEIDEDSKEGEALPQMEENLEENPFIEEENEVLSPAETPLTSATDLAETPVIPSTSRTPQKTPQKPTLTPHKTPLALPNASPNNPPPPPLIRKVATPAKNLDIILPGEPVPLPFDPTKYTRLSVEEINDQIEMIDDYIVKMKTALEPVEKIVKQYSQAQENIKATQIRLNEFDKQLKQCESNLKYLKEQEAKNKIICLEFKRGKDSLQIPFFADDFQQTVLERNQALEKEHQVQKQKLKTEIADKNQILNQCTTDLQALTLDQKEEKKKLEAQMLLLQSEMDSLNSQVDELSRHPLFDKKIFYSPLRLSDAIERFETLVSKQKIAIKQGGEEKKQFEEGVSQLMQNGYQNIDLPTLETLLEKRISHLDKLVRNKASRKQTIKQKTDGKTAVHQPKDVNKLPEVVDEFPELQHLLSLPQDILVLLKGESLRDNDSLEDFRASVYGQIYAPGQK